MIDMGFDFYFFGNSYHSFSINQQGGVRLERPYNIHHNVSSMPFQSLGLMPAPPMILPYGTAFHLGIDGYARYAITGTPGNRIVVFEFFLATETTERATRRAQVHLHEADNSIAFVYPTYYDPSGIRKFIQRGLALDCQHCITIDPVAEDRNMWCRFKEGCSNKWHDITPSGTYELFTPEIQPACAHPTRLYIDNVTTTSADIKWHRHAADVRYNVTYRRDGGTETTVTTNDTILSLQRLEPGWNYEVSVATVCRNGGESTPQNAHFRTFCQREANHLLDYFNLSSSHTECRHGTFRSPSIYGTMVDLGPADSLSQHTVHRNQYEYDPHTHNLLKTVPDGFCQSVRLGNWNNGGEEEDITYIVTVDTDRYDLLILRYAIVEELPNHDLPYQPRFEISINDSNDNLIDACHYAQFIAGMAAQGWNHTGDSADVVWRDWTPIGMDLSPFHGQTIKIKLSNFDCEGGLHYGYSYYVLETGSKQLTSSVCGSDASNVFHAPKGFSYRWYRTSNPTETLSTADSLEVNDIDEYQCYVSYGHGCGFTLPAVSGPRYPWAAFIYDRVDSCGRRLKFINQSVVTRDLAHTQVTGLPCEQFYWDFGDGTFSVEENPTHYFDPGTYHVKLIAMIANGQCQDSLTTAITITIPNHKTLYDTACYGSKYWFYDRWLTQSGTYTYTDGCTAYELHLTFEYETLEVTQKAICQGESILFCDSTYNSTGIYIHSFERAHGCDSAQQLELTVRPLPQLDYELFQTCKGEPRYYLQLPDTLAYSWTSTPDNAPKPYLANDGWTYIKPNRKSHYYLQYAYRDEPACPQHDTLDLDAMIPLNANIATSPVCLTLDNLEVNATDRSTGAERREWLIDRQSIPETGPQLQFQASAFADSVEVAIAVFNSTCTDTASKTIPILKYLLNFPNIISPSTSQSPCFKPFGFGFSDYELWLYDRRGDLVFHTQDPEEPWNGTYKGQRCKQDAYVYVCHICAPDGSKKELTGTVTLIW